MASVRKRTLPSGKVVWQVDYRDGSSKRRHKQFPTKRSADSFMINARAEVVAGMHTPDSTSITVADAGHLWIAAGEAAGLERTTIDQYRQHFDFHIAPYLGKAKLSQLSAPRIREFEDELRTGAAMPEHQPGEKRSPQMIKKVISSLGLILADAQERGLVAQNVVRSLRSRRRRGKERRAEKRAKVNSRSVSTSRCRRKSRRSSLTHKGDGVRC